MPLPQLHELQSLSSDRDSRWPGDPQYGLRTGRRPLQLTSRQPILTLATELETAKGAAIATGWLNALITDTDAPDTAIRSLINCEVRIIDRDGSHQQRRGDRDSRCLRLPTRTRSTRRRPSEPSPTDIHLNGPPLLLLRHTLRPLHHRQRPITEGSGSAMVSGHDNGITDS